MAALNRSHATLACAIACLLVPVVLTAREPPRLSRILIREVDAMPGVTEQRARLAGDLFADAVTALPGFVALQANAAGEVDYRLAVSVGRDERGLFAATTVDHTETGLVVHADLVPLQDRNLEPVILGWREELQISLEQHVDERSRAQIAFLIESGNAARAQTYLDRALVSGVPVEPDDERTIRNAVAAEQVPAGSDSVAVERYREALVSAADPGIVEPALQQWASSRLERVEDIEREERDAARGQIADMRDALVRFQRNARRAIVRGGISEARAILLDGMSLAADPALRSTGEPEIDWVEDLRRWEDAQRRQQSTSIRRQNLPDPRSPLTRTVQSVALSLGGMSGSDALSRFGQPGPGLLVAARYAVTESLTPYLRSRREVRGGIAGAGNGHRINLTGAVSLGVGPTLGMLYGSGLLGVSVLTPAAASGAVQLAPVAGTAGGLELYVPGSGAVVGLELQWTRDLWLPELYLDGSSGITATIGWGW